ncbi:hypothetical protein [Roseivivax sp. CAU 1761]
MTRDNLRGLRDAGLAEVGKIDIYLMDTLAEARALAVGLSERPHKQIECYQNPFGYGLVLSCDPTLKHQITLNDRRKPAHEIGAVEDEVRCSWHLTEERYYGFSMSDDEIEAQMNRFARRLGDMAKEVGVEAQMELRDVAEEMSFEHDLEQAGMEMRM